ncbi:NIPSNAP family containing protein [Actinorhabdospora filicis]|uniref:NIPSNAP family containing protein n=1 Tax=Actinorhabdospora filicis TaxID=1785913 RepID=A0A9W6SSE0_9ACTN|nr:NIPSNAP family protein [Actinorhabdospora filicis]GLZ81571.1 NIPSNAP family containing protein [Actinorhabdospora filicis]
MTIAVAELRRYTLHPGRRDELIELFEREFIETQEETGIVLPGQFRDLDDPGRFVWLRGFASMDERREALTAFYGGPAWKEHRDAANATMIDSDDVLLLRPVRPGSGLPGDGYRPRVGAEPPDSRVTIVLHHFQRPVGEEFRRVFEAAIPALEHAGAGPLAYYETEYAENDFPGLPVRTGEHVFMWVTRGYDPARLAECPQWAALTAGAVRTVRLTLAPTVRSLLR